MSELRRGLRDPEPFAEHRSPVVPNQVRCYFFAHRKLKTSREGEQTFPAILSFFALIARSGYILQ
jgi:hypothetical protein